MLEKNYKDYYLETTMQDSTDNINKEFTDQSWLKMQHLLDEHLPVEAPKRDWKVPFLIALSGLLLLSSAFLTYLYKTHPLIKEVIVEKIIVEKEYITLEDKGSSLHTAIKIEPIQEQESTALQTSPDWSGAHNSPRKALAEDGAIDHLSLSTTAYSNQEKDYVLTMLEQPSAIAAIGSSLPMAPLDAGLGFEKIENDQEENKPERKLMKFELGLLLALSTDLQFSGIGLVSEVKFPISDRFSLNTGLGINTFSGERNILGGPSAPSSSSDVYSQGLNKFKQVYVPLSLDYSVTKDIVVNSGVRLRYTYSEELDSELNKFIQSTPGRRSPVKDDSTVFNNTNLGFSAGVKYVVNQHWSILLDSEWGLSNLIDRTQFFGTPELKYELNMVSLRTNFTF